MKTFFIPLSGLFLFCWSIQNANTHDRVISPHVTDAGQTKDTFKLHYLYVALGSGMGGLAPVFKMTGNQYRYTYEQNSYYGKQTQKPELKCAGTLRQSSIDSIIRLVKNIKDSVIYRTNVHVMSGGIHYLEIKYGKIDLKFTLHNAGDPVARKIVDILNKDLPPNVEKLWIWHFEPDPK